MGELIVEVGVDTHPDFRRRGFGKAVVSAMTEALLKQGRIPVYRCSEDNIASLRLAQSVGYETYAHIVQFYA
jgi:predicted GNAT family acetyltransferase